MLGSGEEPDPLIMKKVEHRGKIPYHKSTTNHNKGKISMLNKDYTAKLLDLEDAIITNVENISGEVHIFLELPRTKHPCPACGALTDRVHDYRIQIIKDVPLGRTTLLHLRKRRYRCDCGKRFFEKNTFLPRYYRSTSRLVAKIITRSTKRYLLQRSARSLMFQVQRLCGTSNTFLSGQPNCQRFFPLTNPRVIPEARNITVSL